MRVSVRLTWAEKMSMMLEVSGLKSGYGSVPVLRGVDLRVVGDECVGVLGRNGMGKTTLLRAIVGELPSWAGSILKDGAPISGQSTQNRARAGLGYVPQGKQIFSQLTVLENLQMGCIKNFAGEKHTISEVVKLLPRLENLLDRGGGSLSGGEQQLLALARCLCGKPSLILLDEPTEGIQPSICDEIVDALKALRKTAGIAVLLVEQDIEFLWALCDRVLAIDKGVIIKEINPRNSSSIDEAKKFIGIEK